MLSSSLPLVYGDNEGWDISSLRGEVLSCSGPRLCHTVHFSQEERVISLPFGTAVQSYARFRNISGA